MSDKDFPSIRTRKRRFCSFLTMCTNENLLQVYSTPINELIHHGEGRVCLSNKEHCVLNVPVLFCRVAAGTAHGFGVFDYSKKTEVATKCTLNPNGELLRWFVYRMMYRQKGLCSYQCIYDSQEKYIRYMEK